MLPIREDARELKTHEFDVVVVGGGTGGVIAAIAAARSGAKTALIESKGYVGGIAVEGGTALHSFFNLWKAFDGVEKRQVVRGLPQELIDRLGAVGGTSGHAEMDHGYDYDSICTAIDTELYKLIAHEMLFDAGVSIYLNTMLADAVVDSGRILAAITQSRAGREAFAARCFVDCTGYGDLAGAVGAEYDEPNDYPVANSIGLGNVDVEAYGRFLESHNALSQRAYGWRSGRDECVVRLDGRRTHLPEDFAAQASEIGMAMVTTTVHDNYFMFIKLNLKLPVSPTDRDAVSGAELELRRRQHAAVNLFRQCVPGCEKAFIARTSPSLCIRRGRRIVCDYDISLDDVLQARHFDDDVMCYGFHDCAPRLQIAGGGTYGIPYGALRPKGVDNLLVAGMMITRDWEAHMSTRNTVCCMGQGQAAGTAAALCAIRQTDTRSLDYQDLRDALVSGGVYFE